MIRRHGTAALSTALLVIAVVLLALSEEKAAVYVTLASIVIALIGSAYNALQRS